MNLGLDIGINTYSPILHSGSQKQPTFDKSLVDAWFMSGLKNEDKPAYISGIKETLVYPADFNVIYGTKENITPTTITLDNVHGYVLNDGPIEEGSTFTIPAYTVEIKSNIKDATTWIGIGYEDYTGQHTLLETFEDGIYNIPSHTFEYDENMPVWVTSIQTTLEGDEKVTITQIPNKVTNNLGLNNFAYISTSGFDNLGALVFDGVDDYLMIHTTNFNIGTIIMGVIDLEDPTKDYLYFIDSDAPRTYFTKAEGTYRIGNNGISYTYDDNIAILNYNVRFSLNRISFGSNVAVMSQRKMALNFIAIYQDVLIEDKSNKELLSLKKEWERRLLK